MSTVSAHQYPPQPPQVTAPAFTQDQSALIEYLIHTDSRDISDVQLNVSPLSHAGPSQPAYFRQRSLGSHNEIIDQLVESKSGRTCWTIHRPTRGWYLYLRSPSLPNDAAISLTSAKLADHDATISPLCFSLFSRVRTAVSARLQSRIQPTNKAQSNSQPSAAATYTAAAADATQASTSDCHSTLVVATGRELAEDSGRGHARKRSAAGSGTHGTIDRKGVGSSIAPSRSPMIAESQEEGDHDGPALTDTAVSNCRTDADLPYSPAKPDNYATTAGYPNGGQTDPTLCTFVLCDSSRQAVRDPGAASKICLQGSQGWLSWAWSILPQELRPELPIGTSKDFSLYWVDPPSNLSNDPRDTIEVLRFQDQSGWWLWNSLTRGRLTIQAEAMSSLGLDATFCITVALAYTQFLEEKDSYEASRYA